MSVLKLNKSDFEAASKKFNQINQTAKTNELCPIHNVPLLSGVMTPEPWCPECQKDKTVKEKEQLVTDFKRRQGLTKLRQHSIVDNKLQFNNTFDSFEVTPTTKPYKDFAQRMAQYYIVKDDPCNVLLYGSAGAGKSHLAMAVANAVVQSDKYYNALFISFPALIEELLQGMNENNSKLMTMTRLKEFVKESRVVIVDDLGAESEGKAASGYIQKALFQIYESNDRVITTTNLGLDELQNKYHERIISRMLANGGVKEFEGVPDHRIKHGIADQLSKTAKHINF